MSEIDKLIEANLRTLRSDKARKPDTSVLRRQARALLRQGKYVEAGTRYAALAQKQTDAVDMMLRAAHAFRKAGENKTAAQWFLKAAKWYAAHDHAAALLATLKLFRELVPDDDQMAARIFRECRHAMDNPEAFLPFLGEREQLGYRLRSEDWFASFTDEVFDALLDRIHVVECQSGETLMHMGQTASSLYIVVEGRLEGALILKEQRIPLGEIGPGDICGEIGYFTGGKRTAEVVALTEAKLLEIPYAELDQLANSAPDFGQRLETLYRSRILTKQLALTPLLSDCSADTRAKLAEAMHETRLAAGASIFVEGQQGTDLYLVRRGRVAINLRVAGENRMLKTVETGGLVGEMAVVTGGKRTASAIAISDVSLMKLPGDDYARLLASHPELRQSLENRKREQMDETRAFLRQANKIEGDDTCELLLREIWH